MCICTFLTKIDLPIGDANILSILVENFEREKEKERKRLTSRDAHIWKFSSAFDDVVFIWWATRVHTRTHAQTPETAIHQTMWCENWRVNIKQHSTEFNILCRLSKYWMFVLIHIYIHNTLPLLRRKRVPVCLFLSVVRSLSPHFFRMPHSIVGKRSIFSLYVSILRIGK